LRRVSHDSSEESPVASGHVFVATDIAAILCDHGWLDGSCEFDSDALAAWCARAADLLSPHAADRAALGNLLSLVFAYDAPRLLHDSASQAALAREGARDVIRVLANRVLEGGAVDSDRYKEIIDALKAALPHRGRSLFFPIRLALAGRVGEGELDRVILLLDAAANITFAARVKGTRQRMLEFCAALD
jgi:hypothetical protein